MGVADPQRSAPDPASLSVDTTAERRHGRRATTDVADDVPRRAFSVT
jgi:hypothetical protein